jgi:CRISPR-associated endonuclease Csn1
MRKMAGSEEASGAVLGLDLGANSVGWSLVQFQDGAPRAIVDCGVRIFPAGMEGDIEAGKGESRAAARREKRAIRRQIDRRRRRKVKVLHQLHRMGLLPAGKAEEIIPPLDREILGRYSGQWSGARGANLANLLPYWLRKEALHRKLEPFEIGRALYHLAQRRGFLSNRKTPKKKDEQDGKVQAAISELAVAIDEAGAQTLGEYLASLDPHERRLRQRWTHRHMYRHEFEKILDAQKHHYPNIFTDGNQRLLANAIFHQRPLKSSKGLIGRCELEPNCRRAALNLPETQRFRYLQAVNNCQVITRDTGEIRPFSSEERGILIEELDKGDLTFAQAKKKLGLKPRSVSFTLEAGGEKRFIGNRVNQDVAQAIGEEWSSFPPKKQRGMIADLRQFRQEAPLTKKAVEVWGLDPETAERFAAIELEPGYASLSRRAIRKILPLLEQGMPYATARKQVYGDQLSSCEQCDFLPPVLEHFDVRNPVVLRSLTDLRKVVNAVIRKHGKPNSIRVELARDMKQGRRERERRTKMMRENESRRKVAAKEILDKVGIRNPSRDDILKVQLAKECNWICPYTGRAISMAALVGEASQFDIEHIIPFSHSLDDSFLNKTLCYHDENRNRKGNRSPYEAYHGTDQWDIIIGAVCRFGGPCRDEKLRRFKMTPEQWAEENGGFAARQLNDTRYASKLARAYLGLLYGGFWDAKGTQRVYAVTGQLTAIIRNMWDMNQILGDGGPKERTDHRHHTVDATAVAMTTAGLIHELADHALPWYERRVYRGRFRQVSAPWDSFHDDLKEAVDGIVVSHRVHHGVNGALHEETIYGRVQRGRSHEFRLRRHLSSLKSSEVARIADPRIRRAVQRKLEELGAADPAKAFADSKNHPLLDGPNGRKIPVHAVRIRVDANPVLIGRIQPRHCLTGSNHHLEILGVLGDSGKITKWEASVVSIYDAMQRVQQGLPVVQKDHGPNRQFLFSISPGDTVHLGNPGDWPRLLHVRTVSQSHSGSIEIAGAALTDARRKADMIKSGHWYRVHSLSRLQELQPSKVVVLPDGAVHSAGRS